MYDLAGEIWTEVSGLPEDWVVPDWFGMSYPTDDGFAVMVHEASASDPIGRSVEGEAIPDGHFVPTLARSSGTRSGSPPPRSC